MLIVFVITFIFLALSFVGLASGFILNKKCIKGSCGGVGVTAQGSDENFACDTCPNRKS